MVARRKATLKRLDPLSRELAEAINELEAARRKLEKVLAKLGQVEQDAGEWNALPDVQARHERAASYRLPRAVKRPRGISDTARRAVAWEDIRR